MCEAGHPDEVGDGHCNPGKRPSWIIGEEGLGSFPVERQGSSDLREPPVGKHNPIGGAQLKKFAGIRGEMAEGLQPLGGKAG